MHVSLEDAVKNYLCMIAVGATNSELDEPLREVAEALKERQTTIDLDAADLARLTEAAEDSNWIPREYYRNDWISDACEFLRTGEGVWERYGDAQTA